mmetsp:Transcript_10925/g.34368  ORF Transcript_10925/g.34368 Transcript_10925/m.34368 type:complete len:83 (+) Transcript_10925:29-277(+)
MFVGRATMVRKTGGHLLQLVAPIETKLMPLPTPCGERRFIMNDHRHDREVRLPARMQKYFDEDAAQDPKNFAQWKVTQPHGK